MAEYKREAGVAVAAAICFAVLVGGAAIYLFPSAMVPPSSSITSSGLPSNKIPAPVGFLGASYASSSGTVYPLAFYNGDPSTVPTIPSSSAAGTLVFTFSTSQYKQADFTLFYQSCSRNALEGSGQTSVMTGANSSGATVTSVTLVKASTTSGSSQVQQICSPKSFGFSYGSDTQGHLALSSDSISLPCGQVQIYNGQVAPTHYVVVSFGVNTMGYPSAAQYFYQYLLYSSC